VGESKLGLFVHISMGAKKKQEGIQEQMCPQEKKSIIMASKLI
jgi:hypothetical protein